MELRRLDLERYKCFDANTLIEIAPLTILVGANNSGKTALAQAIQLFSSSLAFPSNDRREPLLLNSEGITHGIIFQDLVSRRAVHGQLSMSAVFGNGSDEDELSVEIQNVVNASKPSESMGVIKHWSLRSRSNQIEATRESLHEKALYQIIVSGVLQDSQQISWGGLLPLRSNRFPDWANEKMDMIRGWASGVRYLACPRSFPSSNFSLNNSSPSFHSTTGATASLEFVTDDDLRDAVRQWYRNVFGVRLNKNTKADLYDITVGTLDNSTNVSLDRSGAGLSQVLPVAVTALKARRMGPGVDIIELPEAGLHPAFQADVAELFAKNLPEFSRPVIIETHSEMILLRIRRLIAEGKLPSDHVIVYWIYNKSGYGSKLQQIKITDEGTMSSWPEGVFYEDYEEILAIRRAARRDPQSSEVGSPSNRSSGGI